tara:strand:+ start:700 stop:1404 length:705 start_codon:yes stop_codon:yes gene_type:complete
MSSNVSDLQAESLESTPQSSSPNPTSGLEEARGEPQHKPKLARSKERNFYAFNSQSTPQSSTIEREPSPYMVSTAELVGNNLKLKKENGELQKENHILQKENHKLQNMVQIKENDYRRVQSSFSKTFVNNRKLRKKNDKLKSLFKKIPVQNKQHLEDTTGFDPNEWAEIMGIDSNENIGGGNISRRTTRRRRNTRSKTRRNTRSKTRRNTRTKRKNRTKRNTRSKRRNTKRRGV